MLIHLRTVISSDMVDVCCRELASANWVNGRGSAGNEAARAKHNDEASFADPVVRKWSEEIQRKLRGCPAFVANALPAKIFPPSFNRYGEGQSYAEHNDSALMDFSRGADAAWMRSDLACTLFLSQPTSYEGGDLIIEDTFGTSKVKLPAGDLILYPASSQHRIEPVTRGTRVAAYFWIQSLVRDDTRRRLLHEMDVAIGQLRADVPDHAALRKLLGVYHNLLRFWSDT
jgi:PKHD-type hydroxylase